MPAALKLDNTSGERQAVMKVDRGHGLFQSKPHLGQLSRVLSGPTIRLQPRRPKKSCVEVVMVAVATTVVAVAPVVGFVRIAVAVAPVAALVGAVFVTN